MKIIFQNKMKLSLISTLYFAVINAIPIPLRGEFERYKHSRIEDRDPEDEFSWDLRNGRNHRFQNNQKVWDPRNRRNNRDSEGPFKNLNYQFEYSDNDWDPRDLRNHRKYNEKNQNDWDPRNLRNNRDIEGPFKYQNDWDPRNLRSGNRDPGNNSHYKNRKYNYENIHQTKYSQNKIRNSRNSFLD